MPKNLHCLFFLVCVKKGYEEIEKQTKRICLDSALHGFFSNLSEHK